MIIKIVERATLKLQLKKIFFNERDNLSVIFLILPGIIIPRFFVLPRGCIDR